MPASLSGLTFLRATSDPEHITSALREILLDAPLVLPCELTHDEREEIHDLIVMFAGLPVHLTATISDLRARHVNILTEPAPDDLPTAAEGMVIAVRPVEAGRRRIDASIVLRGLRDAVLNAIGARTRDPWITDIATWAQHVADSPSTALRFAATVHAIHLATPCAKEEALVAEGLAELIAWLFRGLDPRVCEWVLARALPAKNAERLVSTEAAILGETAALQRAFTAGLIEHLPDEDEALDLRRPLAVLSQPDDIPAGVDLPLIAARLKARLHPQVYGVIDRWLRARPRPLRLGAPLRRHDFIGREDVLWRLASLFEPAHEIHTGVLYGMAGLGKSATATVLCERLSDRLETVWVTFLDGPTAAWRRVAEALGMSATQLVDERNVEGRPAWLPAVHARMAERDALIVVDDADAVPETDLPGWLPKGQGSCAVLVLSKRAERALQRDNDAISVQLRPLGLDESRGLLGGKVPGIQERIERGEADRLLAKLGGHPGAVGWAAALLEKRPLEEVIELVGQGTDVLRGLVQHAVESLDEEERAVVEALSVAAPAGSPRALIARMVADELGGEAEIGAVLTRLADRAIVELNPRTVKLFGAVQMAVEAELEAERRRKLHELHGGAAHAVMEAARQEGDEDGRDESYDDVVLALVRMTERCRTRDVGAAGLCDDLAFEVAQYPRGLLGESWGLVITARESLLGVWTFDEHPEDWAMTQLHLGIALMETPAGDRADNVLRALTAYRRALTVHTRQTHPVEWAGLQNNIGNALIALPAGDGADNLSQALEAYEAALTVYTRDGHPEDWAMVQNNLGNLLQALPTGERPQNLRRAQQAHIAAMTVSTKESHPRDWAIVQHNLGITLLELANVDDTHDMGPAIAAFEAALTIRTLETVPHEWATTQMSLGNAFAGMREGRRTEHLDRAMAAYNQALRVFTKETFPGEWARTQFNIARVLQDVPAGPRRQNLQAAMTALQGALTVWTKAAYPQDHDAAQALLDESLAELTALGPPTDPPPPFSHPLAPRRA